MVVCISLILQNDDNNVLRHRNCRKLGSDEEKINEKSVLMPLYININKERYILLYLVSLTAYIV